MFSKHKTSRLGEERPEMQLKCECLTADNDVLWYTKKDTTLKEFTTNKIYSGIYYNYVHYPVTSKY